MSESPDNTSLRIVVVTERREVPDSLRMHWDSIGRRTCGGPLTHANYMRVLSRNRGSILSSKMTHVTHLRSRPTWRGFMQITHTFLSLFLLMVKSLSLKETGKDSLSGK